ncbi:hypothetical protein K469DRAFT_694371 [Zopfia rhizophila CBS 207.26]|uniref:DNA ligase D 3'-phosphoesterase domain-containing protein n=1 Tax=Zopfia rhizophila CBS 207.26 TaxID=1314779 RepID=A0A6A6EN99_9PEZI|nr:hypothetical protein K469DRAFT_694371 [Zopfia rhizophila CBS 207.26]
MDRPSSLLRDISPPRLTKRRKTSETTNPDAKRHDINSSSSAFPTLAAVEAGQAKIQDHVAYFTEHLAKASTSTHRDVSRLSIDEFADLYQRNQHEHGNHFVIHQHNHPKAGVHYDVRLQFSETSSISFAVPYGLPGNPNSKRLGRMAIETRVHNLWNHLIESASHRTGSLLIWDTGTYTVLPRKTPRQKPSSPQTTDGDSDSDLPRSKTEIRTKKYGECKKHENEKLIEAFQTRYIHLRLHGTRLPKDYTITLRLPSTNDVHQKIPPEIPRKRRGKPRQTAQPIPTDSEPEAEADADNPENEDGDLDTDDDKDMQTRLQNAYPGATNSIGSIHQRRWYMTLDRHSSGFVQVKSSPDKGLWVRNEEGEGRGGFEPFYIRGRNFERSVVTGRLAADVERDEGVEGFVGRGGWVGITT